jgi:proline iminopeptidase
VPASLTYTAYDGANLAYNVFGTGTPLLVIPGGPARDAAYLGDLGALATAVQRKLVVPDLRGTGASQPDSDPVTHQANRIAADVAGLVDDQRLRPVDLLAHSAGANVALLLAEHRPDLVGRMVLVTPGTRAVGLEATDAEWELAVAERSAEPWYAAAREALEAEDPTPKQELESAAFFYGQWDLRAHEHAASDPLQRNVAATGWFHGDAYDPERTRTAMQGHAGPVRILLGELDVWPNARGGAELAALFPDATVTTLRGAGHFPWVDDPFVYADAVRLLLTS